MTEQHEVPQVEAIKEEQAEKFDSASEEEDDLLQTSTNKNASLEQGCLFFVGRSLRFGRSFKINSKFLSYILVFLYSIMNIIIE